MISAARRPRILPPMLAAGGLILALQGCVVGIEDNPVPPGLVPGASATIPAEASYGAPVQDYSGLDAAEPAAAPAFPPPPSQDMAWQTGPQPVVESTDLPPPAGAEPDPLEQPAAESELVPDEPALAGASSDEAADPPVESAAVPRGSNFRLSAFVGIETENARPFARALLAQANARGITLDGDDDALVLKIYLSSFDDGGSSVLTYVFDVYDRAGTRLTRVDGQEKLPELGIVWRDAPPETIEAVANKAMRRLEAWADGASA